MMRLKEKDVKEIIETNLMGPIYCSQAFSRGMIKNRKGSIVHIGSVVGLEGNIGQTVYSSSKAGLVGLMKSMAKEYGGYGINVNMIAPGYIQTEMTKDIDESAILSRIALKRFGTPQEVADAVSFIVDAKYITGQVLSIDGGLRL
eukprot:TRINITY_DN3111_c0_g1_i1.p1 TRINITY_DN3111_c0_g1~~TRINITY_DN3111_c0_g1_i1.p1  ORF type:complete len:145 (-),score=42.25 TRINITY_DN3111_c0_g1_i1:28-462(-)